MASIQEAKVGIVEARELMPRGREVYETVRKYLSSGSHEFSVWSRSPAAQVLGQLTALHDTMVPPLPDEVVGTIGDFVGQYDSYIEGAGRGYISDERCHLENVANQLVSVVFEFGYATPVRAGVTRQEGGTRS